MTEDERVTVDLDAECYYLDGEFWVSWDNYGEEMADNINKLLNEQEETIQKLKKYIPQILFVLGCSQLPKNTRLSDEEIEAISKLQDFIGERIVDLEKKCNKSGDVE